MGRLAGRVPPPSTKAAIREAYNKTTITAVVDLPAELTALSVSIPATMGITAEGLILDHTLWPFFAAFQASEKRDRSKRELLEGGHPYLRLGLMSSRCPFPKYLRYCPYCVLEDRRRFRETYWRRTLQIPGVVVCPVHGTRLQLSSVPLRHLRNRHEFISAESAIGDVDGEWQRGTDLERFMAESAAWLLKHPDSHCTHDDLQNAFEQSYSIEFLREAGCESETSGTWWVLRLLRKPRGYQHPLRYVLLLHFVGSSPNHFFASGPLSHPFGRAPWPCLNLLSGHYGALTIEDCEVRPSWNGRTLVGFFTCNQCGMQYKRNGPDTQLYDRMRRDHIPEYGPVWEVASSERKWLCDRKGQLNAWILARRISGRNCLQHLRTLQEADGASFK